MSVDETDEQAELHPETWVDRYGDMLYRYAVLRLRDVAAAEDVVQDTFLSALAHRDQYRGTGSVGAWLLGICKRKVLDRLRARHRQSAVTATDLGPDVAEFLFDERGRWQKDALGSCAAWTDRERAEFWEALQHCLDQLSSKQADAFVLRELEGRSTEEICKDLGVSKSNVWVLLHRARLALARCLSAYLED